MKVVLTRKLADIVDGVDLRANAVGEVIDLPPKEASLLIAEQWAMPDRRRIRNPGPVETERRTTSRPPEQRDSRDGERRQKEA